MVFVLCSEKNSLFNPFNDREPGGEFVKAGKQFSGKKRTL